MTEKLSNELEKRCQDLEENLKVVRENIAQAALRAGKKESEVTLLAATKTVPVEVINYGIQLGIAHIGENRVQELLSKIDDLSPCDRQFIGHLQTNKVRQLVGKVSMIQSVDSVKLAQEISKISEQKGLYTDILIEVNIGREENKSGIAPEKLEDLLYEIASYPAIRIRGLMAIPPVSENILETKRYFENMSQYFVDIKGKKIDNVIMDYLSMGMSADYVQAIEAGANLVRVGSSLFGARVYL